MLVCCWEKEKGERRKRKGKERKRKALVLRTWCRHVPDAVPTKMHVLTILPRYPFSDIENNWNFFSISVTQAPFGLEVTQASFGLEVTQFSVLITQIQNSLLNSQTPLSLKNCKIMFGLSTQLPISTTFPQTRGPYHWHYPVLRLLLPASR